MKRLSTKWTVGHCALAAILMFALLSCSAPGSREITIVYATASGLEVGDELRMSGYAIGTVESLALLQDGQIGVHVRIEPKYTEHITEGVTFAVKRESVFSAGRFIEMTPGDPSSPSKETQFVGVPTWEFRLRSLTDQLLDATGDTDFRQHLEALAETAERAARAGQEEWEARRPELEKEAKRLLDQIDREGSDAAEQLRREIERYLEELMEDDSESPPADEQRI